MYRDEAERRLNGICTGPEGFGGTRALIAALEQLGVLKLDEAAKEIDPIAFRPAHIGDDLTETDKDMWLRRRNVALYKAGRIAAIPQTTAPETPDALTVLRDFLSAWDELKPGLYTDEQMTTWINGRAMRDAVHAAREVVAEPPQSTAMTAEPVAWRWRWADSAADVWQASTVNPDQLGKIVEPLYAAPPSPDTVREKDRADLAEKHLNQIYDYLGCCRSGSAVICTIKEREAALSSAPVAGASAPITESDRSEKDK